MKILEILQSSSKECNSKIRYTRLTPYNKLEMLWKMIIFNYFKRK